jgi:CHASE2 domain-containing sensor protein
MVLADNATLIALGEDKGKVKRTDHVRLLDHLTPEKPRLVFYDFAFDATNSVPDLDYALGQAIAKNGAVILVGACNAQQTESGLREENLPPIPGLRTNALGWGHAEFDHKVVRTFPLPRSGELPAAWIAATNISVALTNGVLAAGPKVRRWLSYYGRDESRFQCVRFQDIIGADRTLIPTGFFSNKYVFVGQGFQNAEIGAKKDTFQTPYSRLGAREVPGVDLHATVFLNLIRGDWLQMVPWWWQVLLAIIWGVLLTVLLYQLSRRPLVVSLLGSGLAIMSLFLLSMFVQWRMKSHWWWGWFGPAIVQSGCVLMWSRRYPRPSRYDAFISYRRTPDLGNANSVHLGLRRRGYAAFLDLETREPGQFPARLRRGIEQADFFLVILSTGCLARRPNAEDWMREEIAIAQQQGKPIIPLLMPGFDFKSETAGASAEALASELQLKLAEAVPWHADESLDDFIQKVVALMRKFVS